MTAESLTDVAGLILAGGASQRMGAPKATRVAHGASFLEHVAASLRTAGIEKMVVVAGAHFDSIGATLTSLPAMQLVRNSATERGPISSIISGLDAIEPDEALAGVIVSPVDHPAVRPSTIRLLLATARQGRHAIVVPTYAGRRGHPTWFSRDVWPELRDPELRDGAKSVVRRHTGRVAEVSVEDEGIHRNIDTPEALVAWQRETSESNH